ncbi:helix-turn-helix domain-containing protein [Vibrio sp. DW001]|uniref:helix-turn-helix domain-containing protein n=1 Tax=Vibrio sp. DW001 TaxID=2912315 RepID=UPI0023AE6F53|nr:helix-turn-helix domain-containing protein [Vibrio sp. DW001]WED29200.1 helix-turn-helix domain-containing protein [Vibrio sp. DW001]
MSKLDRDWHVADIRAALAKCGTNYEKLAKENGIAGSTLRNALRFKYPKAERIIAKKIGVTPEEIWPSRYLKKIA